MTFTDRRYLTTTQHERRHAGRRRRHWSLTGAVAVSVAVSIAGTEARDDSGREK